jgi:hypothetical protein
LGGAALICVMRRLSGRVQRDVRRCYGARKNDDLMSATRYGMMMPALRGRLPVRPQGCTPESVAIATAKVPTNTVLRIPFFRAIG